MSSNNHNENDETSSTAYNNSNSIVPQALDAPLLDDYLSTLLLPKLSAVLSNNHDDKIRLSNEFQLALLQMVAILWTRGHTPSLQTLPLKLTKGRGQKSTTTTTSIILWYAVLSVALPTLYESAKKRWTAYVAQETLRERFEAAASSTTTTTTPKQDKRQLLMRQRRRLAISTLFRVVDTIVPMLRLGCLLSVWRTRTPTLNNSNNNNNIHLAPTLAMKLLGLHYVATTTTTTSSSSAPLLQVYYAHRRWLHDEVTRLLPLVLVPLQCAWSESTDYVQSWFRLLSSPIQRHVLRLRKKLSAPPSKVGDDDDLTRIASRNKSCPVCQSQSNPIAIPYETDCGHIYCYTCLWTDHVQHQERNCRICHERIQSCRPVR